MKRSAEDEIQRESRRPRLFGRSPEMNISNLMNPERPAAMTVSNLLNPERSVNRRPGSMTINSMLNPESPVDRSPGRSVRVGFDVVNVTGGTRPSIITLIPARLVGEIYDEETLRFMAIRLRSEILRLLRRSFPTMSERSLGRVSGTLMMQNHDNESHTYMENVSVGEISPELFIQSFENATGAGSNPDLQIRDVDWSYWINPASLQRGAGSFTNPLNYEGITNWNSKLKRVPDVDTSKFGCAVLALANSLQLVLKEYTDKRYAQGKIRNLNRRLYKIC